MNRYFQVFDAPFGAVTVVVDVQGKLCELWTREDSQRLAARGIPATDSAAKHVGDQLSAYFDRKLTEFDLPLALEGTPFQLRVWNLLQEIPYGQTRTYGDLAGRLGLVNAARAVGRANGTNPISIVVPCHRVIGADGSLTGYGGGLNVKRKLLEIESGSGALF